jgi:tetratricopeptide (TPR) repeat protein
MAKKSRARKPQQSAKKVTDRSGGIDLNADEIDITGDVVGRDKIVIHQYFTAAQMALQPETQNRLRVLFVGPRPLNGKPPLFRPEGEWRLISNIIERRQSPIALVHLVPPTFSELQQALADPRYAYDIVHIVGSMTDKGLDLECDNGSLDSCAIEQMLSAFQHVSVQLIVLNIGDARPLAEAFRSMGIAAVLASTRAITDDEAEIALQSFYAGLGDRQTLQAAYEMGRAGFEHKWPNREYPFILLADKSRRRLHFPRSLASSPKIFTNQPPHNSIPALTGNFVDRESALTSRLFNWLRTVNPVPMMALTGLGGIGKRTLAIAAAERYGWLFPGGIIYLTAHDTRDLSPNHVAEAIDMALDTHMMKSDNPSGEALKYLETKRCLLILDRVDFLNDEQQQSLAHWLSMLSREMGSRVLLTMRPEYLEPFRSLELMTYQVGQLDLPAATHLLQSLAATNEEASQRLQDHLSEVAQAAFCHPFLLGVAVAMAAQSPLTVVLDRFRKLHGGFLDRDIPRLIGEMVASVTRNSSGAERLLCALAVFQGGASYTALARVYDEAQIDLSETLDRLKSANLIELDPKTERYTVISLIAEWAIQWGTYTAEDWTNTHQRHVQYFLEFARQYHTLDRSHWAELDIDWENVRAAANWITGRISASDKMDTNLMMDLIYALLDVISARRPAESEVWLQVGLAASRSLGRKSEEGWIALCQGSLDFDRGNLAEAKQCFESSAELFNSLNNRKGLRYAHGNLSRLYHAQGSYDQAAQHYQRVTDLCSADNDLFGTIVGHINLGDVYRDMGDFAQAKAHLDESVRVCRESKAYYFLLPVALGNLAELWLVSKDIVQSFEYAEESWRIAQEIKDKDQMGVACRILGDAWDLKGDGEQAVRYWNNSLQLLTAAGLQEELAKAHENLGRFLLRSGSLSEAHEHLDIARRIYETLGAEVRATDVRNLMSSQIEIQGGIA